MLRALKKVAHKQLAWGLIALAIVQTIGAFGLFSSYQSFFLCFTGLNLMLTFGVFCYYQFKAQKSTLSWIVLIGILGWSFEVMGVHTGLPFGDYAYGEPLGFQPLQTPITIGMTWSIMAFGARFWSSKVSTNRWISSALAAGLMVAIDLMIEPVAIYFDFWHWADETPPLMNYVGWFLVGFALQLLLPKKGLELTDKSGYLLVILAGFFALSSFLISL